MTPPSRRLVDPHICIFVEASPTPGLLHVALGQHGFPRMDAFTLQATVLAAAAKVLRQTERRELAVEIDQAARNLAGLGAELREIAAGIEEDE